MEKGEEVAVLIVWQAVLGLVFVVLYGFGEHNNKKPCPLFMQINERIEIVFISPEKNQNQIWKFHL